MATDSNGVLIGDPPAGVPHLAIPFALAGDGTAEVVQQGSTDEIVQCVANLVGTTPGTRFLVPTYGIPEPTFGTIDRSGLNLAVAHYEPRASVTVVVTPGNRETVVVGVQRAVA